MKIKACEIAVEGSYSDLGHNTIPKYKQTCKLRVISEGKNGHGLN